ncbi:MAG: RNA polymerase sigma factor [bacterium]|nr:RNA polymerase sigma factor [bacterium]
MNAAKSEQKLLQGLIERDERTAEQFYEKHFPQIYRMMYFSVATETEAEDLTRDAFLAFFESLPRFKGKCRLSTWLYSIAKNHLRNYYTRKKRRPMVSLDNAPNPDMQSYLFNLRYEGDGPEELASRKEAAGQVHYVLEKLPDNYREVLLHRYINGLATAETAEIMGKTEGNIRVLLHRAGKAFAEEFHRSEMQPPNRSVKGASRYMYGAE